MLPGILDAGIGAPVGKDAIVSLHCVDMAVAILARTGKFLWGGTVAP